MDLEIVLKFLKNLSRNNDREWFEKHKPRYLEAKHVFEEFVGAMLTRMVSFDEGLAGLNPKKLPFRIYRDVRFSKDKRPYKTNFGAGFSPNGRLIQEPGYYLHLEPGNRSFIAGGIYQPEPDILGRVRQEIDYNAPALKAIFRRKGFAVRFADFDDFDKLKTAPKGYPKDHPEIEWLKLKSFIVSMSVTDKEVTDTAFLKKAVSACKEIKSLNDFIREAIS